VARKKGKTRTKSHDHGGETILKVSNLSVDLDGGKILDNISFSLKKGVTLAIVGPNGAGKTTLLRALLNRVEYTGRVEWNERLKIGYVPQSVSVSDVPISVREFLHFKSREHISECLEAVGLKHGILDKRMDILSGGERQRVLIAWALLDDPDMLLFDEPTAHIDSDRELIYMMLNKLEQERGITVLLVTHNPHVVRHYSDYVLAINRKTIFFGKSEKINTPKLLQEIYGSGSILQKHKH
jgi:zinc transport system ATP-binding protein